jgi:rsbT co-antagonist protein RsbR
VSEMIASEMLTRLLERVPGVFWASRMDPRTLWTEWVYVSPRLAELYGLAQDELRRDPSLLLTQTVPEDRARLEQQMAASMQTLAPTSWTGRVDHGEGRVRWIETLTNVEREADGRLLWWGQVTDVTERKKMEQALVESEAARARSEALYRQVIDALPVGVMVANQAHEFLVFNPAQQRFTGGLLQDDGGDVSGAYGLFMADGKTPLPTEDTGLARGLRGEALEEEVVMRNPRLAGETRMHVVWTPLRDANGAVFASLGTAQDITLQRALEGELRTRNEELAASEEAKTTLIERLRRAVDELSNPILEVGDGVLAMPLIGIVDSHRTADMVRLLLAEVARTQATFVIIDLTGVELVDTTTADHLMKLMRKVEVVGAQCVLTGIRSAVAETLVDIGVDFGRIRTLRNLKHGLREALRMTRSERDGLE